MADKIKVCCSQYLHTGICKYEEIFSGYVFVLDRVPVPEIEHELKINVTCSLFFSSAFKPSNSRGEIIGPMTREAELTRTIGATGCNPPSGGICGPTGTRDPQDDVPPTSFYK